MKPFSIICLIFFYFPIQAACQDVRGYSSQWQVKLNSGFNIPLSRLLTDTFITNNLVGFRDRSMYWNVSVAYFFHKHWGIELAYQPMMAKGVSGQTEKFNNEIRADYKNNFYIDSSASAATNNHYFDRGFIGFIYRMEKGHWLLYPKLSVGVASFYLNSGYALLKEKNTNRVLALSYEPSEGPSDHFTMAVSATLGYKLSKQLYLNIDMMASRYNTNFTYSKELKDRNTNVASGETFVYKKKVSNFNAGAGIIIAF